MRVDEGWLLRNVEQDAAPQAGGFCEEPQVHHRARVGYRMARGEEYTGATSLATASPRIGRVTLMNREARCIVGEQTDSDVWRSSCSVR